MSDEEIIKLAKEFGLATAEYQDFNVIEFARAITQPKPFVRLTDEEITEIIGPYSMGTVGGYTRKLFDTIQDVLEAKNR